MEYKGKLYGKLGNDLYFDTSHTTDEWDKMEAKIKELEQPKRKPLPDGTLPMTSEELEGFRQFIKDDIDTLKVISILNLRSLIF
jgi:hypothetical protein